MDRNRLVVIAAALAITLVLAWSLLKSPAPTIETTLPEQTAPAATPSGQPQ
jgi:hypothetical protein